MLGASALMTAASFGVIACDRATGPKGGVRVRWYVTQAGYSDSRPAVGSGDVVFVGTGDGKVVARANATGLALWSTPIITGGRVDGTNLIARSGVVVAVATYDVVGLDAATGAQLWRYGAPPDPNVLSGSQPGLVKTARMDTDGATLYVPAWGASVSAVDLETGFRRWAWVPGLAAGDTASSGLRYRSGAEGVRISGDTLFVGVWHNLDDLGTHTEEWVVALDRATGRELWRAVLPAYTFGVTVDGAPALSGNLVLLGSVGGDVWAVDRTTHALAWHFKATPHLATIAEPEAADGVVYRDGGDEQLYALRASDGAVLWKAQVGGQIDADLLVTARRVHVTNGQELVVLDRATGRRVATVKQPHPPASGGIINAPAGADGQGHVFITMSGGTLSFDEP